MLDCRGTGGLDCRIKKCSTVMGQERLVAMDKRLRLSWTIDLDYPGKRCSTVIRQESSTVLEEMRLAGEVEPREQKSRPRKTSIVGRNKQHEGARPSALQE